MLRSIVRGIFRLNFIFFLLFPMAVQAKKHIVYMDSHLAFEKVHRQMQERIVPMSSKMKILGVTVNEVKSLKNLGVFIVDSDEMASIMENYPGVESVTEDIIFQGVPPFYVSKLNHLYPLERRQGHLTTQGAKRRFSHLQI